MGVIVVSGKGLSFKSKICRCNSTQFLGSNTDGCVNYYSFNLHIKAKNQFISEFLNHR